MNSDSTLHRILSSTEKYIQKPESFLSVQNEIENNTRDLLKQLYDYTKVQIERQSDALPELLIEDFDEEQIWQQCELQNESELKYFLAGASKVIAGNKKLTIPSNKPSVKSEDENENDIEEENESTDKSDDDMALDDIEDLYNESKKKKKSNLKTKSKPSVVDDKFFKLQELDEYLNEVEKKEYKNDKESDDSDNESVDMFEEIFDEEEQNQDPKYLKYADFFDNPENDEENNKSHQKNSNYCDDDDELGEGAGNTVNSAVNSDEEIESPLPTKKVKFNLTNDSDETDSTETNHEQKEEEKEQEVVKSSFEARQERAKKKILEMEEAAVSTKPWQLKGEITAQNRPQNSLLEEFVEVDFTSKSEPIITEKTTFSLEDILKQRIKDHAMDSVEKKFKPVETPLEYKKKLILDQEKSKESLSQIYEKEYLMQKKAVNPENEEKEAEEPEAHIEIRKMMTSLFLKLDALSNFHYTPKMVVPEIKIISNVSAANMEEVAPMTTSDATLLAPEEVKSKPRGEIIGKSERTETDKKRERRKKKRQQKIKQKASEEKEKEKSDLQTIKRKSKSKEDSAIIKKLMKDRHITKLDESSAKAPKSSTAFFNQLQDEIVSQIKSQTTRSTKKKVKKLSSVKLML